MAAKLTFEAKMQGMEQVLDLLKRAEERINEFGRVGSYSLEGVDRRMKEFTQSLEYITKAQTGMGGITKSFDELNKKSNEFLGKSYKGMIDAMKYEVKQFSSEADKILNKIKEQEAELDRFRSKRDSMKEQDFQRGLSERQREISMNQSQAIAMRTQQYEMESQLRMAQPVPGLYDVANRFGMAQYGTVGGAMKLGAFGIAGLPIALQTAGNLGVQYGYTREMDAFLAQARLSRSAASQAMAGDPTAYLLQQHFGNPEGDIMNSYSMRAKVAGSTMLDNTFIRAGIIGVAGLGGFLVGGPVGAAVAGGTAMGMVGNPLSAQNRSGTQIAAEEQARIRERLGEMYGPLFQSGTGRLRRQGEELQSMQRLYGIEGTNNLSMWLASQGLSADRANPIINAIYSQGMLPGNMIEDGSLSRFGFRAHRYGLSDVQQRAIIRASAISGGGLDFQTGKLFNMFGAAGLGEVQDSAARNALGDYVSSMAANRGAGQDLNSVGAGVAAAVGSNAPGFNSVEGVQQGVSIFERQNQLMQGGSSAFNMVIISKLRMLGITNPVIIDALIKRDITNPKTKQIIANMTGKSMKEVAAALGDAAGVYEGMFSTVIGQKAMEDWKKAGGGDLMTQIAVDVRAGENTAAGGTTFTQGGRAALEATGVDTGGVSPGRETMADRINEEQAKRDVQEDAELRKAFEKTGTEMVEALTNAVLRGFDGAAQEVRKAGDQLIKQNQERMRPQSSEAQRPFGGTRSREGR